MTLSKKKLILVVISVWGSFKLSTVFWLTFLSTCLLTSFFTHLYLSLFIYLFICLFIDLRIYLLIYSFIYLSIHWFTYLFAYLFIHLFILQVRMITLYMWVLRQAVQSLLLSMKSDKEKEIKEHTCVQTAASVGVSVSMTL